ncbi:hypothetical protein IAU60_000205 [Kwoniella sp. DSM 27419]
MKIAIIGGGVSGLSALWVLDGHTDHEVHIYEKADWWGGHAHTVEFQQAGKQKCEIDTAFIAINQRNYPNFYRFLQQAKVQLCKTDMSFSFSRDRGAFEWASTNLSSLFCQLSNLYKPRIYRMMWDIFRFNLFAVDLLSEKNAAAGLSIGEYLNKEGYSQTFKEDYLLPLTAGIWSVPPEKVALDFPAIALVNFFHNHQLLQLWGKPAWLTIKGGSKNYVERIIQHVNPARLHLNAAVAQVQQVESGVLVRVAGGADSLFDKVIIATHSDQAVRLLGEHITDDEKRILGACTWSANEAVVHYDEELLPVRKKAWTAWNYMTSTAPVALKHERITTASDVDAIAITFNMNLLQDLPVEKHGRILVTLNPPIEPNPAKTLSRWVYHHPQLTPSLLRAQEELPSIQGKRGLYFVGAYQENGFHECGWTSGMEVAYRPEFGLKRKPWEIARVDATTTRRSGLETVLRGVVGGTDVWIKLLAEWLSWLWLVHLSLLKLYVGQPSGVKAYKSA